MTCTFFGHRDCPSDVYGKLYDTIVYLIENQGVNTFLVGEEGGFDRMVQRVLLEIQGQYPNIACFAVKAYYNPQKTDERSLLKSIYPECLEAVPKRFAIDRRNRYMIDNSDFVVTYVTVSFGGAAKFADIASRKSKKVINLASDDYLS
jgi:uncharacterized phage-like protein YoqJ